MMACRLAFTLALTLAIAVAGAVPESSLPPHVRTLLSTELKFSPTELADLERGPEVLQIGRFSSPPVMGDLDGLTIDQEDLDLRACRIRDCDIRLPGEAI